MIWIALASLLAGIGCGHWLFSPGTVQLFSVLSEYALYLLMFAVGISVGANRTVFRKLREYNLKILLIPAGILLGTVLGGLAAGPLLGMPVKDALSVACGLGMVQPLRRACSPIWPGPLWDRWPFFPI